GRKIGEVDELLVDRTAMKVRYLDVEMDDDLDDGTDKHILIPIGYARLDEAEDQIRVDTLDSSRLGLIPSYTHGPLTREYETDLRTHYAGTSAVGGSLGRDTSIDSDNDLYAGDMYDDRRFYGSRRGIIDRDRRTGADEL